MIFIGEIQDYLNEYRISKAVTLLINTDKNITEIAEMTGFSTTSYFISRFRQKMGITPFQFRSTEKYIISQ